MTFRSSLIPNLKKIPIGIAPLFFVMVFTVSGTAFFAFHTLLGPEIGLTKEQRQPNYVGQKANQPTEYSTKMYNVNPILK